MNLDNFHIKNISERILNSVESDPFLRELNSLFIRQFPDLPLPQKRQKEIFSTIHNSLKVTPKTIEASTNSFKLAINTASGNSRKLVKMLSQYIVSVLEVEELVSKCSKQKIYEAESNFLKAGEVLNKVFILYKYLREKSGYKVLAIEKVLELEKPFRESLFILCMAIGKTTGHRDRLYIAYPQESPRGKLKAIENLKNMDDSTLKDAFKLMTPGKLAYCLSTKVHAKRCFKLCCNIFDGGVIASENIEQFCMLGGARIRSSLKYMDALKIIIVKLGTSSNSLTRNSFCPPEELVLDVSHSNKKKQEKIRKDLLKKINTKLKYMRDASIYTPGIKAVVLFTTDTTANCKRNIYVYQLQNNKKHFLVLYGKDKVWELIQYPLQELL